MRSGPKNIVKISEYQAADTVKALEELLAMAKKGQVSGLIFGIRRGPWSHTIGITGFYRNDPISALGAAGRIFAKLNKFVEQTEEQS